MTTPLSLSCPTVVALDPGGVTGWSVFVVHPQALSDPRLKLLANILEWQHGQIFCGGDKYSVEAENAGVDKMIEIASEWPGAAHVIETFTIRKLNQSMEYCSPIRLTAAYDMKVRDLGVTTTYRQEPSDAKSTCSNTRLKEWGLYVRQGGLDHARDADRHAILALRHAKDARHGPARRHEWWPHLYGPDGQYRPEQVLF